MKIITTDYRHGEARLNSDKSGNQKQATVGMQIERVAYKFEAE